MFIKTAGEGFRMTVTLWYQDVIWRQKKGVNSIYYTSHDMLLHYGKYFFFCYCINILDWSFYFPIFYLFLTGFFFCLSVFFFFLVFPPPGEHICIKITMMHLSFLFHVCHLFRLAWSYLYHYYFIKQHKCYISTPPLLRYWI